MDFKDLKLSGPLTSLELYKSPHDPAVMLTMSHNNEQYDYDLLLGQNAVKQLIAFLQDCLEDGETK